MFQYIWNIYIKVWVQRRETGFSVRVVWCRNWHHRALSFRIPRYYVAFHTQQVLRRLARSLTSTTALVRFTGVYWGMLDAKVVISFYSILDMTLLSLVPFYTAITIPIATSLFILSHYSVIITLLLSIGIPFPEESLVLVFMNKLKFKSQSLRCELADAEPTDWWLSTCRLNRIV